MGSFSGVLVVLTVVSELGEVTGGGRTRRLFSDCGQACHGPLTRVSYKCGAIQVHEYPPATTAVHTPTLRAASGGATRRTIPRRSHPPVMANTIVALLFISACSPYRTVMEILTRRDYVDGEMQERGRARIAGSASALRFGRFGDCPAPAGVPCHNALGYALVGFCGDRYWDRFN